MAKFISNKAWTKYQNIISDFVDKDAGLQPFLWLRHKSGNQRYTLPRVHGEDAPATYDPIKLEGLFHYNFLRTWPFSISTPSGAEDNSDVVLYITKKTITEQGYLNKYGRWDFDNVSDRFVLQGQLYRPAGDTSVSQAQDSNLLFFVVLQKEDLEEEKRIIDRYSTYIE